MLTRVHLRHRPERCRLFAAFRAAWHDSPVRRRGRPNRRDQVLGLVVLGVLFVAAVAIERWIGVRSRQGVMAAFGLLIIAASVALYFGDALWDAFTHRNDPKARHSRD